MARFKKDKAAQKTLAETVKLSDMKSRLQHSFLRGRARADVDLVDNPDSIRLI